MPNNKEETKKAFELLKSLNRFGAGLWHLEKALADLDKLQKHLSKHPKEGSEVLKESSGLFKKIRGTLSSIASECGTGPELRSVRALVAETSEKYAAIAATGAAHTSFSNEREAIGKLTKRIDAKLQPLVEKEKERVGTVKEIAKGFGHFPFSFSNKLLANGASSIGIKREGLTKQELNAIKDFFELENDYELEIQPDPKRKGAYLFKRGASADDADIMEGWIGKTIAGNGFFVRFGPNWVRADENNILANLKTVMRDPFGGDLTVYFYSKENNAFKSISYGDILGLFEGLRGFKGHARPRLVLLEVRMSGNMEPSEGKGFADALRQAWGKGPVSIIVRGYANDEYKQNFTYSKDYRIGGIDLYWTVTDEKQEEEIKDNLGSILGHFIGKNAYARKEYNKREGGSAMSIQI